MKTDPHTDGDGDGDGDPWRSFNDRISWPWQSSANFHV